MSTLKKEAWESENPILKKLPQFGALAVNHGAPVHVCISQVKNIQDGCGQVRGWLCLRGAP